MGETSRGVARLCGRSEGEVTARGGRIFNRQRAGAGMSGTERRNGCFPILRKPRRPAHTSHQGPSTTSPTSYTRLETLKERRLVSKSWILRSRKHLFADVSFRSPMDLGSWKQTLSVILVPLRIVPTPCWLVALRSSWSQVQERMVGFGYFPALCGWWYGATQRTSAARRSLSPLFHGPSLALNRLVNLSAYFSTSSKLAAFLPDSFHASPQEHDFDHQSRPPSKLRSRPHLL